MIDGNRSAIKGARKLQSWMLSMSVVFGATLSAQTALANTKSSAHSHASVSHSIANRPIKGSQHLASARHHEGAGNVRLTAAGERHHGERLAVYETRHSHYRLAAAHYRHSWLQCVPYAREVSHIDLTGNAFLWWAEAAGRYARGNTPQEGAVLNFRSIHRMPLGHVAVVTAIIDARTILVTQANWIRGTITNDVTIQDVSPDNDWTDVQVELGDTSTWGAAYPTYGFIYNQPAITTTIASNTATTSPQGNEVAEAPKPTLVANDAPDRNLQ